jgi:enoyl-CoA hydratase
MTQEVLLERFDNGVALVTLNRPQAMNALSQTLRQTLGEVMAAIRTDDTIRAVVLTGAGERAFTAGLDLKELGSDTANLNAATDPDPVSNPVNAVRSCGKPVIGAINGVAISGGCEVALACDILLASGNARFADTHALVGIMPGWGLSQKLARILGISRAKELSFSGRFIDAQTACDWGLVNHVYAPGQLLPEALALAEKIASVDAAFINNYRNLMETGYSMHFADALEYERVTSTAYNTGVSAAEIEQRRGGVMAKGRAQQ